MNVTKAQIRQFAAFLESIEGATSNKSLMGVIKSGFAECYPINEAEDDLGDEPDQAADEQKPEPQATGIDKIKAFFGKAVPQEKLDGFAKAISKAMEKTNLTDVAEFAKKALNSNPKQEFVDAATEFLSGGEKAVTEGVADKMSKLVKVLAVSAMLAGGASAGDHPGYEKVKTEQGDVQGEVEKYVKVLLNDDDLQEAMESGDDVRDIIVNHKAYKAIVAKFNSMKATDEAMANAFARGVNRKLKELFSSDAPLIGAQRS